jgi:hypothetical protein
MIQKLVKKPETESILPLAVTMNHTLLFVYVLSEQLMALQQSLSVKA